MQVTTSSPTIRTPDVDSSMDEYVTRLVAQAPPLTAAKRDRIIALLRAGRPTP